VVSGGNYAIANKGDVTQNSGNNVDASNSNTATQVNNQGNGLAQTQSVWNSPGGCCSGAGDVTQSAHQSNRAENSAHQTGVSSPVVVSGRNVAFLNHGGIHQNSGNNVDASNTNTATQTNNQSNSLSQTQTVDRGGCCPHPCEPRCEPEPCEPRPCEPRPCEPNEHEPRSNSGRGNLSETGTGTRQSNSSTLKNPHEGQTGPGDYPTGDFDPGNSGPQNRGGD
jgi:hypothetical protein